MKEEEKTETKKIDSLIEALNKIEQLTRNSGNGEIFRIHEIAKEALK